MAEIDMARMTSGSPLCMGRLEYFISKHRRIGPDRIQTVNLGSNFTVRIFCQVSFCQCKISGLEFIF